jgi:uncharacterized protein (DUF1501 family)
MNTGCSGFTRSELLRAAAAGDGLPAIEPGMPIPAGSGLSRRSFLMRSIGLGLSVYGASRLPLAAFDEGVAHAATGNKILVSIFLEGGADPLGLLVPAEDPKYAALRPTLSTVDSGGVAFADDDRLSWHPAASSLATLHAEGKVSVLPSVGYDDPNASHFTARHFYEIGELDAHGGVGWLGRFLDLHGEPDNPLQGLSLSRVLMPTLATSSAPVAAVLAPDQYTLQAAGVQAPVEASMIEAFARLGEQTAPAGALRYATSTVGDAARLHSQLAPFTVSHGPGYPNHPLGSNLSTLASMIDAGLPLRCVALNSNIGWDHHSMQITAFPRGIKVVADALLAFQRDLEARGLADRVLVNVWSEFGRRAAENGSQGTDHGAGGFALVIGSQASGEVVGEWPGIDQLDHLGNLRVTSDYRSMYCSLLEQWLGVDAGPIIPGADGYDRPMLVAA